uniref:APETALA3-like protein n=1 Tax=Nymphaea tetragona TaxID=126639 RepID=Q68BH5_9MAGN|nr:APETALA3-like protein [Nymphaea tetragona]
MGRGKIEIMRIENTTNRQVTFSKRRAGIIKKAKELTVLCDAHASLILFSSTHKLFEYCSPTTTMKKMIDRYQQVTGTNLWDSHYESMQKEFNKLKEKNERLRKSIRQRIGEDLDELNHSELCGLEQNLSEALKKIRLTLENKIKRQIDTCRKKIRLADDPRNKGFRELQEEINCSFDGSEDNYESMMVIRDSDAQPCPVRVQSSHPNLHERGYGCHDLVLG